MTTRHPPLGGLPEAEHGQPSTEPYVCQKEAGVALRGSLPLVQTL